MSKPTSTIAELDSRVIPLQGSHLIEASAGTGKTYNIVRIYLRLLLEKDYTVGEILVMTFTVAATAEIRNRLNEFLRDALAHWHDSEEPVIVKLRQQVDEHKAKLRLQQAILQLDEAAIYTIHGFCKRALSQQAFFSGLSFNANMEADASLLRLQATEDWYRNIQRQPFYEHIYNRWPTPDTFAHYWLSALNSDVDLTQPSVRDIDPIIEQLRQVWPAEHDVFAKLNKATARSSADTLQAYEDCLTKLSAIAEGDALPEFTKTELDKCFSTAKKQEQMPVSFALVQTALLHQDLKKLRYALDGVQYIRNHIHADKKRLDQLDFNDLITELRDALHGTHAIELSQALHQQFPAALVDEFQDTDPDQYSILSAIYKQQPSAFLCMIGDPKQAIYGFRGGDVFAYLEAKRDVDHQWTMNTNHRSSPAVIAGYNQTFLQAPVDTNSEVFGFGIDYRKVAASNAKADSNFSDQRSAVQWVHFEATETPTRGLAKSFQHTIAQWVSSEIVQLLTNVTANDEAIKPGDIALLVRSYGEATLLQQYLTQAGLASVYLSARQNVFQTAEATSLFQLLTGIWQFENDRLFIAALASTWIGLTTEQLDAVAHDEHQWSAWQEQFEQWRADWQSRGLMSMVLDILQKHTQPKTDNIERTLTNCLHLAERLQMESSRYRMPDALLHWFERALDEDSHSDDNVLRLESDNALIKIITLHGAKGLEYPIVFLPFVSYFGKSPQAPAFFRYHQRDTLAMKYAFIASQNEIALATEEDQAELVRLLYVAVTRAEKRLYCCMAPFASFASSALAQTLKLTKYSVAAIQKKVTVEGCASVISVDESSISTNAIKTTAKMTQVTPAQFGGHIERDWWLSSFSALTRHVGHSSHSAPDRDEQEDVVIIPKDQPLRFRLTKGAEAGNLLHDALEHCDFSAPNFKELFEKATKRYSSLAESFTVEEFEQWITQILQAPVGNKCLADFSLPKTLRESEFYFPMGGSRLQQLARFIGKRRNDQYDLPERYKLKGMMHGFIDLIFEMDARFYVADYKSTHLGFQYTDYEPTLLQHSIYNSSYDVQYAIYALALHRYLKSRIPDYLPESHFGGVYYFYLRGMHPNHNTGVFYDAFSNDELNELDAIFAHSPVGATQDA